MKHDNSIETIRFDYSKSDSVFNSKKKIEKNEDKKFDYKEEVLDFSTDKAIEKSKKIADINKKFDLNTISVNELIQLPGIGSKVSKNIIEYRNRVGKFKDINQLLEIKGIGERKFVDLKKFLIIK